MVQNELSEKHVTLLQANNQQLAIGKPQCLFFLPPLSCLPCSSPFLSFLSLPSAPLSRSLNLSSLTSILSFSLQLILMLKCSGYLTAVLWCDGLYLLASGVTPHLRSALVVGGGNPSAREHTCLQNLTQVGHMIFN